MSATRRRFAHLAPAVLAAALALGLPACTAVAPGAAGEQTELDRLARAAVADAMRNEPAIAAAMHDALGCAVFPTVGKGAAILGFAYGRGIFYEHNELTGYCDLTQGSLGVALGAQGYTEIICFLSADAVTRFKRGVYTLNTQVSAVAFYLDAGSQVSYAHDVAEFLVDGGGLMLEAAVGTQQLRFRPVLGTSVR